MSSKITFLSEVGSTQDVMAERIDEGAEPFEMLVAHSQTAGRGRMGRTWVPGRDRGLYASTYLHLPEYSVDEYGWVTLLAGIATQEAIWQYGVRPTLKWPNDLLLDGGKVCGILTELHGPGQFVVGVGLNLTQAPDVDRPTASLSQVIAPPSVEEMARTLSESLKKIFTTVKPGPEAAALYRQRALFGVRIQVHTPAGLIAPAIATDITDSGALVLVEDQGKEKLITCGDAEIVKGLK